MDTIKKPETLIASSALLISGSTAIYFHKQNSAIKEDIVKLSDHLTTAIRKLNDNQIHGTHISQLGEAVKQLNSLGMRHNQLLEGLIQSLDDRDRVIDGISGAVYEMQKAMREQGVNLRKIQKYNIKDLRKNGQLPPDNYDRRSQDYDHARDYDSRYGRQPSHQPSVNPSLIHQSSVYEHSHINQQPLPQQPLPQQSLPQQPLPQQSLPQQSLPQQHLPQQPLPQQHLPQPSNLDRNKGSRDMDLGTSQALGTDDIEDQIRAVRTRRINR